MPEVYNTRAAGVPKSAVYVARPSIWGNPFHVQDFGRDDSIRMYREWLAKPEQDELRARMRQVLRGKDLICWCAPQACHADIILEVANSED